MVLFRRLFYRKPPDRLLEISDRIYVFDCCFFTEILEEDEYKVYMCGIVAQHQDHFPDASFMVFNFKEGERRSQVSDILSEYDMTVMACVCLHACGSSSLAAAAAARNSGRHLVVLGQDYNGKLVVLECVREAGGG